MEQGLRRLIITAMLGVFPFMAFAQQQTATKLDSDEPIEVVSDTLEVFQPQQKAIFRGNVIATQGNINMRSAEMTVYYRDSQNKENVPTADGALGQGIYKIEAEKDVFFASPTETAKGDHAIYEVDRDVITLFGNVFLTRQGNVLKGTKMVYNLATGRSVLVGAAGGENSAGTGRVRGLFVPKKDGQKQP